ncbi:hypothetical protein QR685DRAFT_550229 [Neurospora intermedia]|uniref:EKC/KEOPS complex subunit GON7 n=1 Tax=Neurospora intermedia TaxID=5142 RepID=A0ABR3DTP1_NEUIN
MSGSHTSIRAFTESAVLGEQTATTLEASLTRLENTLDQLLASMEEEGEEKVVEGQGQDSQGNANGKPPQDQSKGKDEK